MEELVQCLCRAPTVSFGSYDAINRRQQDPVAAAQNATLLRRPSSHGSSFDGAHDADDSNDASDTSAWTAHAKGDHVMPMDPLLYRFFDEAFYMMRHDGIIGPLYVLLYALDPYITTLDSINQQKIVTALKRRVVSELPSLFKRRRYNQFGYRMKEIRALLSQKDEYADVLGHCISDFLNINLLALVATTDDDGCCDPSTASSSRNEKPRNEPPAEHASNRSRLDGYRWIGTHDPKRATIVLFNNGLAWSSVVHTNMRAHFLKDTQYICDGLARLDTDTDTLREKSQPDKETIDELKRSIRSMKLKEMHELAMQIDVDIYRDGSRVKKLKADLMNDLINAII